MAIYTLDQAIIIIFNDREYYLKMNKAKRTTFRNYKSSFNKGILSTSLKIKIVENYGGKTKSDIKVEL